jgi:nucleotide-binding universal stress UspA family protein
MPMFKHILLPTDGSAFSYKAVEAGVAFARESGARITGYHALPPPYSAYDELDREIHAGYERRAREEARIYVEVIGNLAREHGVLCALVIGTPRSVYDGIIETAKDRECDLIFMASHGRTGSSLQILGSVAQKVIPLSTVPVLVFRTR